MDVELDIDKAISSFAETAEKMISGDMRGVKVTKWHFVPAPKFQPEQITHIRKHLHLTQEAFAAALNVRRDTVASWETGRKKPVGAALRLLELVKREPSLIALDCDRDAAELREEAQAAAHRHRTPKRELVKC
jgi:putative transcriptional regulator